jgi:hypothetical protein
MALRLSLDQEVLAEAVEANKIQADRRDKAAQ